MIIKDRSDNILGYTNIDNRVFRDGTLSLKAIGLYCLIRALPETWNLSVRGLATLSRDRHTSVRAGLKELEEAGYLLVDQGRNKGNKFSRNDCVILCSPSRDFPKA